MLAWFDTNEIEAFASSLASEFCQRAPVAAIGEGVRGAKNRFADAQSAIMDRVTSFVAIRRLNLYKRASLANKFKWALLESGYAKSVVDQLVLELVKHASRKG